MPSGSSIESTLRKMQRLAAFFLNSAFLSFPLPEEFADFRKQELVKELKVNLTMLRTSKEGLEDLNARDKFKDDPGLQRNRYTFLQDASTVLTYFETELLPRVTNLHQYLKDDATGTTLAKSLQEILVDEPAVFRRSGGPTTLGELKSQRSGEMLPRRTVTSDEDQSSGTVITVSRRQLERLKAHQRALDDFVQLYMVSREQLVHCEQAKSKLEEGRRKDSTEDVFSDKYWKEIKTSIKHALMIGVDSTSLIPKEFKKLIDRFTQDLEAASNIVISMCEEQSPQDVSPRQMQAALAQCLNHVDSALLTVEHLAGKCQDGAKAELRQVDELIKGIFEQVQEPLITLERSTAGERGTITQVSGEERQESSENPPTLEPETPSSRI